MKTVDQTNIEPPESRLARFLADSRTLSGKELVRKWPEIKAHSSAIRNTLQVLRELGFRAGKMTQGMGKSRRKVGSTQRQE